MDIILNYKEKGTGTPFILLHGNGESSDYFIHQIEYFSKSYRVIAIDTRGQGKSPRGEKTFSLFQFAEDLKDFLDEMKISKAILLGFSDGGNIAMLFSLKYPEYVEKLIFNGANLNPKGVKASVQWPIIISYYFISLCSFFNSKLSSKKEILRLMVKEPDIKEGEISKISIPTLVIAGDNDMIKYSHTINIAHCIKTSTLSIIKGNHFIAAMNSGEFNKQVSQFLLNETAH